MSKTLTSAGHELRPLIIKIGGAGVDTPSTQSELWHAVLRAHAMLRGQLVLVHGGGRAVDAHLDRLGFTTERREGLRLTPPEQMPEITAVLAGKVNKALVGAINAAARTTPMVATSNSLPAAPAVGLCLGDGNLAPTVKRDDLSFDPGRVGRVATAHGGGSLLVTLMRGGYLPVLCSIGLDDHGEALNVNADDAAAGIAQLLSAQGLVLLTDVPAVLDEQKRPIASLSHAKAEDLIARGVISGGMIPKVRAALAAARAAGAPAFIASWNQPGDLVRLAAGEAIGTRCTPD